MMKKSKLFFALPMILGSLWLTSCHKDKEIIPDKTVDPTIQATAAGFCQCVSYVENQLGMPGAYTADARYWGDTYTPANYVVVPGGAAAVPTPGDIMVFLPGFGQGVNITAGHIGIIKRITYLNSTDYDIVLRGANQNGSSTEVNCNNVNDITYQVRNGNRSYTRYLRRNPNFSYLDNSFFPSGAVATAFIPNLSLFTSCGGTNTTGGCSSTPYNAGIIRSRVLSVTPQWIKIRLEKCSGAFSADNTIFIKDANVCGTILAADYILSNWTYRDVTIPNNLVPGQWKIYYPITISTNGTKCFSQPLKIRG